MKKDCNILNASCVLDDGIQTCYLQIRNGKITGIYDKKELLSDCENELDAAGLIVLPGMIDSHVHIRGGDFSYREDFFSGSRAALSAGITTILEMPGCAKPASTVENFKRRVEEVKQDGAINFGLYGGAGYDNLEEIPRLKEAGAIGFKTFQMAPVAGREKEFYGLCTENYKDMVKVMSAIKTTGLTLTVHCESQEMIDKLTPEEQKKHPESLRGFIDARPPEAEKASVELTLRAAKETGCRTIIAHVSAPESVAVIGQAKKEGYPVYAETCAHYLMFDKEQMIPFGVFARMKPPFRKRSLVDEMAALYAQGKFDITGSDHAPFTIEEKTRNGKNVWKSVDGLYGLELTLPLLLNLAAEGKLSYETIARCFSRQTAELFGLSEKGRIAEGCDADLVFVKKLEKPEIFHKESLLCKCKEGAVIYDGIPLTHKVIMTMLDGEVKYQNEQVMLEQGSARILCPNG